MNEAVPAFRTHDLGSGHKLLLGYLPVELMPAPEGFQELWQMHPQEFHEIRIHGRLVKTPRWQQAFGRDYHYSGRINRALPLPPILEPFLRWACQTIQPQLNGVLLNWYDGTLEHYIGRHRDSTKEMVPGSPIVTISLGGERIFRLRRWHAKGKTEPIDFPAQNGTVFVMPWNTNLAFTHEVPASSQHTGRRISITLRAFK